MVQVGERREAVARRAANELAKSITSDHLSTSRSYEISGPDPLENEPMSPVRRTFCLIVTFDLIFTFLLWIIYTQLTGLKIQEAFEKQVANYTIETSLFDVVLLSCSRFVILLLAYALFHLNHWWVIAISTTGTCGFLIAKVFLFTFNKDNTGSGLNDTLDYLVLISNFIIAWIETWFLDFKVFPREKKMRVTLLAGGISERTPLLSAQVQSHGSTPDSQRFYSPVSTPEGAGSDEEDDAKSIADHQENVDTFPDDDRIRTYLELARKAFDQVWHLYSTLDEWKLEEEKPNGDKIFNRSVSKMGKFYRAEGDVDCNAKTLYRELIGNAHNSPSWNPTVLELRILEKVSEDCEVLYNNVAEAAGGVIQPRDFVSLRYHSHRNDVLIAVGSAVTHPDAPVTKKFVRGENGPGGYLFQPINDERCRLIWILNTNLKGWIPQVLIDQALSGVMLDYLKRVRERMKAIQ